MVYFCIYLYVVVFSYLAFIFFYIKNHHIFDQVSLNSRIHFQTEGCYSCKGELNFASAILLCALSAKDR